MVPSPSTRGRHFEFGRVLLISSLELNDRGESVEIMGRHVEEQN